MPQKSLLTQFIFIGVTAACMSSSLLAAWGSTRNPAGQMCPDGSYVIGFDSETNIICSETCGNGVLNQGESCDDGNTKNGDSCPATCQSDAVKPAGVEDGIAIEAAPEDVDISSSTPHPIISKVKPSKATVGTREVTITVSGTGFHQESVIIFDGVTYPPSVNQEGTQLKVTIPTRNLNIGPYAVTVSNGSGMGDTLKRALEIY